MHLNDYILVVLILLAVIFDITQKKIPNFLTLPVILWGLATYTFINGFSGFIFSFWGFLLGLGIFLIPYVTGGMGGGDVKFMAAIGALKGAEFILMVTIFTAICGGLLAIIYLAINRQLLKTLRNVMSILLGPILNLLALRFRTPIFFKLSAMIYNPSKMRNDNNTTTYLPYGVAIALGTIIVLSGLGEQVLPLARILGK